MNYANTSQLELVYTIPVVHAAKNQAANFHLEVHELATQTKTIVNMPTVVPAVAPVLEPASPGSDGSATFANVPLPNEGFYVLTVYYGTGADLDADLIPVSLTPLASAIVNRVAPVASVAC